LCRLSCMVAFLASGHAWEGGSAQLQGPDWPCSVCTIGTRVVFSLHGPSGHSCTLSTQRTFQVPPVLFLFVTAGCWPEPALLRTSYSQTHCCLDMSLSQQGARDKRMHPSMVQYLSESPLVTEGPRIKVTVKICHPVKVRGEASKGEPMPLTQWPHTLPIQVFFVV
jgi:hypothetical protein